MAPQHPLTPQMSDISSEPQPAPLTTANTATPRTDPLEQLWASGVKTPHPQSTCTPTARTQPKQKVPKSKEPESPACHIPHPPPTPCGSLQPRHQGGDSLLGEQQPTSPPGACWCDQGGPGPSGGCEGQGSCRGPSLTSDAGVVGDAHDAVGIVRRRCHLPRAASAVPAGRNPHQLMAMARDPSSHTPPQN